MTITPYLYYEDLAAMIGWLGRAFGFEPHEAVLNGPDGAPSHAAMKLGEGIVMMGRPAPAKNYRNPKRLGGATQSLYVMVDDVDEHFRRAKREGAGILEEPADTPYGQRRYGACDPEGHEWYFAQEREA